MQQGRIIARDCAVSKQRVRNMDARNESYAAGKGRLVYRQNRWTRLTHWLWAASLFFLLLSGLQIFNAHPTLYLGEQSGFAFDNAILRIGAVEGENGLEGTTELFGKRFETTGVLGLSERNGRVEQRGFPAWATLPSYQDLATGRVVHFFFAWLLAGTLLTWFGASLINGHLRRDVLPNAGDLRSIGRDIADHARLRFHHGARYGPLQKLSYATVLLFLLPLMILTGLAMSPGMNAALPWLTEVFGGRQTARSIHFLVMLLLVLFFVVHIAMVLAAGPLNELRSILTGWYRTDDAPSQAKGD